MIKNILVVYLCLASVLSIGVSYAVAPEHSVIEQDEIVIIGCPDITVGLISNPVKLYNPQPYTNNQTFEPSISVRYKNALFCYQSNVAVQLKAFTHNFQVHARFILPPRQYVMSHTPSSEGPHLIS